MVAKIKRCKDCDATSKRSAPHPGPRCATHHRAKKKADSQRAAEQRWAENYSITPEQYDAILEIQGGGCGFCLRPPGRRRLAIDHDHACCPGKTSCGKCVRGLLCWTCNKFSEHIDDSELTVARMSDYYREPPARRRRQEMINK